MSKDTHFIGQPVYIQLLNLVDRNKIRKISCRGGHDRYVKKLDGYTHFVAFLFAVLMRYDTLRETIIGMMPSSPTLPGANTPYPPTFTAATPAYCARLWMPCLSTTPTYRHSGAPT